MKWREVHQLDVFCNILMLKLYGLLNSNREWSHVGNVRPMLVVSIITGWSSWSRLMSKVDHFGSVRFAAAWSHLSRLSTGWLISDHWSRIVSCWSRDGKWTNWSQKCKRLVALVPSCQRGVTYIVTSHRSHIATGGSHILSYWSHIATSGPCSLVTLVTCLSNVTVQPPKPPPVIRLP